MNIFLDIMEIKAKLVAYSALFRYMSAADSGKHREAVWQVKWVKDTLDGYLNFYSISGDGRVREEWMVAWRCHLKHHSGLQLDHCEDCPLVQ